MMLQLNPTIPIEVQDLGKGYAFALIDYGQEFDLLWVTFLDETGACVVANNCNVRIQSNWSMCRWDNKRNFADVIKKRGNEEKTTI